jgi:predicted outer membrane repeat protein
VHHACLPLVIVTELQSPALMCNAALLLHCYTITILTTTQGTFANNTATGAGGGALYANSTTDPMTATNVLFQNNTATAATGVGGTAYLAGSKGYVFDNSGFLASTSGSYGGALYVST